MQKIKVKLSNVPQEGATCAMVACNAPATHRITYLPRGATEGSQDFCYSDLLLTINNGLLEVVESAIEP